MWRVADTMLGLGATMLRSVSLWTREAVELGVG